MNLEQRVVQKCKNGEVLSESLALCSISSCLSWHLRKMQNPRHGIRTAATRPVIENKTPVPLKYWLRSSESQSHSHAYSCHISTTDVCEGARVCVYVCLFVFVCASHSLWQVYVLIHTKSHDTIHLRLVLSKERKEQRHKGGWKPIARGDDACDYALQQVLKVAVFSWISTTRPMLEGKNQKIVVKCSRAAEAGFSCESTIQ